MQKLIVIIFCLAYNLSYSSPAALSINPIQKASFSQMELAPPGKFNIKDLLKMKVKDIEKLSGRKLTLKEKIAFLILKLKLKKNKDFFNPENSSSAGNTALILGILALIFALIPWYTLILAIPLGILAITKGSKARRAGGADARKGNAGKILGFIALGILLFWLLLLLVIVIIFSSIFWGWG